jgi:hypothetical protein
MNWLKRFWNWIWHEEGMTWERYHRNMDEDRRKKNERNNR